MGLAEPGGLSAQRIAGFQESIIRILGEQLERLQSLEPSMRRKGGT
jgi:hypothetical protein